MFQRSIVENLQCLVFRDSKIRTAFNHIFKKIQDINMHIKITSWRTAFFTKRGLPHTTTHRALHVLVELGRNWRFFLYKFGFCHMQRRNVAHSVMAVLSSH